MSKRDRECDQGIDGGCNACEKCNPQWWASLDKKERLAKFCEHFIFKNEITCAETISQCDWVIEGAYEFIEGVADIVGYHDRGDDDEIA